MTFFLILTIATIALGLYTRRLVASDERGDRRPPTSHPVDQRFLPPASRF